MKKILSITLALVFVISVISFTHKKVDAKSLYSYVNPKMNSIKITWDKKKKATKYVIYRAVSKEYEAYAKKNAYKKLKTVRYKLSYIDKKVKKGKYYAYYVNAYKGKKLIGSSYDKDYTDFYNKGLNTPEIINGGYKDDFQKTYGIKIYLLRGNPGYKESKKIEIYRKVKGDKSFKKIKAKKVSKDLDAWKDTGVRKGTTYIYKARTYITKKVKKKKKKIYSNFSKPIEVNAANYSAKYSITALTPSGVYEDVDFLRVRFVIRNTDPLNGRTVFRRNDSDYDRAEYYIQESYNSTGMDDHKYFINWDRYSYDNETYNTISKDGIELPKNKPLYIEAVLKNTGYTEDKDSRNRTIYFAGPDTEYYESGIYDYGTLINYYGPVDGTTYVYFDIKNKTGYTEEDWDY